MAVFPHTRFFMGKTRSLVVSGPHLQVLDTQTGEVLISTATFDAAHRDSLSKSGPVRCVDVDAEFTRLVTSGEDKQLKVWRLDDLQILSERELPKKPTDIHFTRDGQTILVSDKFGDIFSYPLYPTSAPETGTPSADPEDADRRSQIVSHDNPSDGTLILGHTSLLTSFLLTEDEKYIISADRDEHIRVSWYPQGYVIERFCLGHRKFVHTVHVPKFAPCVLVSGGGDPVLKLWDWMGGELLCNIPIGEIVERFIEVLASKSRWGRNEGNEEGGKPFKKEKRRGYKGKQKEQADADNKKEGEDAINVALAEEGEDGQDDGEDATMRHVEGDVGQSTNTANSEAAQAPDNASGDAFVLVVHRVATVEVSDQGRFLVFNAIGATALFFCQFPSDYNVPPIVEYVQLHKPVIDFVVDDQGRIWALVDGDKDTTSHNEEQAISDDLIRLLKWSEGKLVEAVDSDNNPLLRSLNTTCKLPASSEDLKAVDLYLALSSMPKHVDPEHDPFEGVIAHDDKSSRADTPQTEQKLGKRKAGELTQREQARLKKKQAVLAKLQEQGNAARESIAPIDEVDREIKKPKAIEDGSA